MERPSWAVGFFHLGSLARGGGVGTPLSSGETGGPPKQPGCHMAAPSLRQSPSRLHCRDLAQRPPPISGKDPLQHPNEAGGGWGSPYFQQHFPAASQGEAFRHCCEVLAHGVWETGSPPAGEGGQGAASRKAQSYGRPRGASWTDILGFLVWSLQVPTALGVSPQRSPNGFISFLILLSGLGLN